MINDKQEDLSHGLRVLMPLISRMSVDVSCQIKRICDREGYQLAPEEAGALMMINHCEGLTQSELANMLGKDKASVTRLMNVLVKSGLVGRIQDARDRRVIRACITAEGKKAFTRIFPQLMALSQQVLQGLTHEDITSVQRIMTQMIGNLLTIADCAGTKEARD